MHIRFPHFDLDGKSIFLVVFGIFLVIAYSLHVPVAPFRFDSLTVLFFFLLVSRTMVEQSKFTAYYVIAIIGLLLSTFLSPYGLLIYCFIAMMLYKKTNLLN